MVWIAALALAALNSQVSRQNEVSCDLAPFVGGGSSSEGGLDSFNGLGLGCSMVLYDGGSWTVGPRVDFAEQRWTVFRNVESTTLFNSYQARSAGLGLSADYALNDQWKLGYAFTFAQGKGQQDLNMSTPESAQNLHVTNMSQKELRQELTVTREFSPRLTLLAGIQFNSAQQSWNVANGNLDQENVAPGNKLTLTSGTGSDIQDSLDQSATYKAVSFKVGVQMLIYSSL